MAEGRAHSALMWVEHPNHLWRGGGLLSPRVGLRTPKPRLALPTLLYSWLRPLVPCGPHAIYPCAWGPRPGEDTPVDLCRSTVAQ